MAFSGMSIWKEQLASKKSEEEKNLKRKYENHEPQPYSSDTLENKLEELNTQYVVEENMRETFKLFDEEFIFNAGNSKHSHQLGKHVVDLYPRFIFGGTCSDDADRTLYDQISFRDYMQFPENRVLYGNLVQRGCVVLEYPRLKYLCEFDAEINASCNVQEISNKFRPYVKDKGQSKILFMSSRDGGWLSDVDTLEAKVSNRMYELTRKSMVSSHHRDEYLSRGTDVEAYVSTLIANIKRNIPVIKEYFQVSNEAFCRDFGNILDFQKIASSQIANDEQGTRVLRSGRRY